MSRFQLGKFLSARHFRYFPLLLLLFLQIVHAQSVTVTTLSTTHVKGKVNFYEALNQGNKISFHSSLRGKTFHADGVIGIGTGYTIDATGITFNIRGVKDPAFFVFNGRGSIFKGGTISGNPSVVGIQIFGQQNIITGMQILGTLRGIELSKGARWNDVTYNLISGTSQFGIVLDSGSYQNGIGPGNNFRLANWTAVHIRDKTTHSNKVFKNTVESNANFGIELRYGTYNNFIGPENTVRKNGWAGIFITDDGTDSNQVFENTLQENFSGIEVKHAAQRNQIGPSNIIQNNKHQGVVLAEKGTEKNIVRENTIFGNGGDGIEIYLGDSNLIHQNAIGLTAKTGGQASPNKEYGIIVRSGKKNTIGPDNIVSHNDWAGIAIHGTGSDENIVQTNQVSHNANGIEMRYGAKLNKIGPGNIVVWNKLKGVLISDKETTGNEVFHNSVGEDPTTNHADPNGSNSYKYSAGVGIVLGASNNLVGPKNLISGNLGVGVRIHDKGTYLNRIHENLIGTSASGNSANPNHRDGIDIGSEAYANSIYKNVISGNLGNGIKIEGPGQHQNSIKLNRIGAGANVNTPVPNQLNGILLGSGAKENVIGGVITTEGNIISSNKGFGIELSGKGTDKNTIIGNTIGCSVGPTCGNFEGGIGIGPSVTRTMIGPKSFDKTRANIIARNGGHGVQVANARTNSIRRNSIYENGLDGIYTSFRYSTTSLPWVVKNKGKYFTSIEGRVLAEDGAEVDLFWDRTGDGEGELFLGSGSVKDRKFTIQRVSINPSPEMSEMTATVTHKDGTTSSFGDSREPLITLAYLPVFTVNKILGLGDWDHCGMIFEFPNTYNTAVDSFPFQGVTAGSTSSLLNATLPGFESEILFITLQSDIPNFSTKIFDTIWSSTETFASGPGKHPLYPHNTLVGNAGYTLNPFRDKKGPDFSPAGLIEYAGEKVGWDFTPDSWERIPWLDIKSVPITLFHCTNQAYSLEPGLMLNQAVPYMARVTSDKLLTYTRQKPSFTNAQTRLSIFPRIPQNNSVDEVWVSNNVKGTVGAYAGSVHGSTQAVYDNTVKQWKLKLQKPVSSGELLVVDVFTTEKEISGHVSLSLRRSGKPIRSSSTTKLTHKVKSGEGVLRVPRQYSSIQKAIDAAKSGQAILVAPGVYSETLTVANKRVTIKGRAGTKPVINAASKGSAVVISGAGAQGTTLENLEITGGLTTGNGGGLSIQANDVILKELLIRSNSATAGGGIYAAGVALTLQNSFVIQNKATNGAAMFIDAKASGASISHTTISDNKAALSAGALYDSASNTLLENSIVWNNTAWKNPEIVSQNATVRYSVVKGGWNGTGIIAKDPQLRPGAGGYSLAQSSPCIDAAKDSSLSGKILHDFEKDPRYYGKSPDMGADEYVPFQSLRGNRNDLRLQVSSQFGQKSGSDPIRIASDSSGVSITLYSPEGTLVGEQAIVYAEIGDAGSLKGGTNFIPQLHINPSSPVIFPFTPLNGALPKDGKNFRLPGIPGLRGKVLRLQAVVLSKKANDGAIALSNAIDIVFQ